MNITATVAVRGTHVQHAWPGILRTLPGKLPKMQESEQNIAIAEQLS